MTATTVLEVRTSPHAHSARSVEKIMANVVFALLPICGYAIWLFGISSLALLLATTAAALGTEQMFCRASGKGSTIGDFSAVITGLLLGLTLPPGLPLWMGALGAFIAVGPGKMVFGGLGFNVFNPALVGRAFLQAAFPVAITTYTSAKTLGRFTEFVPSTLAWPFMKAAPIADWVARTKVDGFTGATPLMLQKFDHVTTEPWSMFLGERAGSAGETAPWLILLCGLYLIIRGMMSWRVPAAMLLSSVVLAQAFHMSDAARYPGPLFVLFSGGLMLGAMFMATDPVAQPVTPRGMWIYGILMGTLTVAIRFLGGLAEGVMYAILLGNALSPLIDNLTQPKTYGERRKAVAK